MSDQLSFRLDTDLLPDLPDLRPMEPRLLPEPFDSDEHLFEPWWGGVRAFAYVGPAMQPGGGVVRIVDGTGRDVSSAFPELAGMAVRLTARSAILDGELVVVDGTGRADPAGLARRLAGEPGRPAAFLAFDLLHVDGRSLLSQPLVKRRETLRRILRPGDEVVAVPAIATEGKALFAAAAAQGIAGILARSRQSPYFPGVRSRLWRLIPATAVAGGAGAAGEGADAADGGVEGKPLPPPTVATAPVLALISRLPLDDIS